MKRKNGFTLLEVLLVIAIIAILAGIVIIAINPTKQLAEARNSQRKADVNTILNAVYQYAIDNGSLPAGIGTSAEEICIANTATTTCTGSSLAHIHELVWDETYLVDIPSDPNGTCDANGVCYEITKTANGKRVTVSAPDAELGETISVTR